MCPRQKGCVTLLRLVSYYRYTHYILLRLTTHHTLGSGSRGRHLEQRIRDMCFSFLSSQMPRPIRICKPQSFPQKSRSLFNLLFLPAKHVEKGYQGDINPGLRSSRNARKDVFDHSFGHPYHTDSGSHIEAEDDKQEPELRGFVGHVNMNTLMRAGLVTSYQNLLSLVYCFIHLLFTIFSQSCHPYDKSIVLT